MNCHGCMHIRYDGCPYGRCSHPLHPDVVLVPRKRRKGPGSRRRPYNKERCADYAPAMRCSGCKYWERGEYFRNGAPSRKGRCLLDLKASGGRCDLWRPGSMPRKTDVR